MYDGPLRASRGGHSALMAMLDLDAWPRGSRALHA